MLKSLINFISFIPIKIISLYRPTKCICDLRLSELLKMQKNGKKLNAKQYIKNCSKIIEVPIDLLFIIYIHRH